MFNMRNFTIKIFVLWMFTFTLARAECESKTHIFLIHGIGGDATTFGSMEEFLNKKNECYLTSTFIYDTGNNSLSTYDFAEDLDNYISSHLTENQYSENDKISLVMHSQGGIVGSLWLLKVKNEKKKAYERIDSFITLSTPYWGSSMAKVGTNVLFTLPAGVENPFSPVGRIELQEMSYGSSTIHTLESNFQNIFKDSHIRFLAIGGLKSHFNPYVGEDDTTVSVYSSRPDHYSYTGKVHLNALNLVTSRTEFKKEEAVPFIPVSATHFPLDIPGVAKLEASCLTTQCEHPSIGHIVKHLNGEITGPGPEEFKFRKYRVHVYLDFGGEVMDDLDKLSLYYLNEGKKPLPLSLVDGKFFSSSFSDILSNSEEQAIKIVLEWEGEPLKVIEAPVKGGFSTFVNLELSLSGKEPTSGNVGL